MTAALAARRPRAAFTLPRALEAAEPPEARGLARDEVRLMVARAGAPLVHTQFRDLGAQLRAGDLLVVNESAVVPAALPARRTDGTVLTLHVSTPEPPPGSLGDRDDGRPTGRWVVELRAGATRFAGGRPGEALALPGGATATLVAPYLGRGRLWVASLDLPAPMDAFLAAHGRPVRYAHQRRPRPLGDHQTIFARAPGSAEAPSAGRPFSPRVLHDLAARGVGVARLVLHAGVSSPERGERPYPERFAIPAATAVRVNATRRAGGRVIAVGTTVTRALETAAAPGGGVRTAAGWTSLVIEPGCGVRVVDGLITGWHEPEASHLLLLEAVAGAELVARSYAAALALRYRWHEFGDSHLLLP